MKKLLFIVSVLCCFSGRAAAQDGTEKPQPNKGEIIQKIIIGHLTQKLNLSVDEAQKFWPVFNNFQGEYKLAVTRYKDDVLKKDEEILNVKKKYKPEFQRVLNSEQRANTVYKEFDKIVDRIKNMHERQQERRENRQNNPPPRLERRGVGRNNN